MALLTTTRIHTCVCVCVCACVCLRVPIPPSVPRRLAFACACVSVPCTFFSDSPRHELACAHVCAVCPFRKRLPTPSHASEFVLCVAPLRCECAGHLRRTDEGAAHLRAPLACLIPCQERNNAFNVYSDTQEGLPVLFRRIWQRHVILET